MRRTVHPVPRAPWGRFPLSELCVLGGLVLVIAGALTMGHRGFLLAACGLTLGCLAGAELALREHLARVRADRQRTPRERT